MKIMVYPTKASALNVRHPISGILKVSGSEWIKDGFTNRMLTDNIITRDRAKAYVPPAPAAPEKNVAAGAAKDSAPSAGTPKA